MKVLLLCPDLKGAGGVANYYRGLELQKESNIDSPKFEHTKFPK